MRRILITAALAVIPVFAQPNATPPVAPPADPHDPITASGQTPASVETVQQRAAATTLLMQASDHYAMHAKGTPAHVLQMSFNATASTLYPAATGQLTETWISGQNWRWDGSLGSNYALLRISSNGVAYDQTANQPMPLHMKMLTNTVFAPMYGITPRTQPMRTASVSLNGTQVTCILLGSGVWSGTAQGSRGWDEAEYCVDPSTGLLRVYSEVPGIFAIYDYTNALKFHDRILPGAMTIEENGAAVVQAQLTSIADTDPNNTAPFTPTAQMMQQGPAAVLFLPMRMNRFMPSPSVTVDAGIQPVIVHITLDQQGKVGESELLQTTSMSQQALDLVKQIVWPTPETSGTPPRQREAFVRVEYAPLRGVANLVRSGQ
jgi:hypothetical protein